VDGGPALPPAGARLLQKWACRGSSENDPPPVAACAAHPHTLRTSPIQDVTIVSELRRAAPSWNAVHRTQGTKRHGDSHARASRFNQQIHQPDPDDRQAWSCVGAAAANRISPVQYCRAGPFGPAQGRSPSPARPPSRRRNVGLGGPTLREWRIRGVLRRTAIVLRLAASRSARHRIGFPAGAAGS